MKRHCVRMKLITWRNTNQKRIDTSCGSRYPLFARITATASTANDLFELDGNHINKRFMANRAMASSSSINGLKVRRIVIYLKPD